MYTPLFELVHGLSPKSLCVSWVQLAHFGIVTQGSLNLSLLQGEGRRARKTGREGKSKGRKEGRREGKEVKREGEKEGVKGKGLYAKMMIKHLLLHMFTFS